MKENEFIRKVIGEKILNRESIRDHAICTAEAKLRLPHSRSRGSAKPAGNGQHANGVEGVMGDVEKDKKKRDTRRLVLATNLVLAVVLSGLIFFTATGLIRIPGLPVWGNNPTTTAVITTAETTHAAFPAGEPSNSKAGDIIGTFQKNLWEYEGGSTSQYPEYYAGAYFEKEASLQGFTVLVTCEPSTVEEKLTQVARSTFGGLLPMNVVRAERSYNQLLRQYNAVSMILNGKQDNLSDAEKTVLSRIDKVVIDEKSNEVYIEVKKGTGEEILTLYRAMRSLDGYVFDTAEIRVYAVTEETQPTVPTVSASDVFHDFLTQKNLKMTMNSGASDSLHLPDDFTAVMDGYSIGEFLRQRNELSKQSNLDFSSYMGKDVVMYIASINTDGINTGIVGPTGYGIVTFVADGKVVAYWAESGIEDPVLGDDYQVLIRILKQDGYKK